MENSQENMHVDTGAQRVKGYCCFCRKTHFTSEFTESLFMKFTQRRVSCSLTLKSHFPFSKPSFSFFIYRSSFLEIMTFLNQITIKTDVEKEKFFGYVRILALRCLFGFS